MVAEAEVAVEVAVVVEVVVVDEAEEGAAGSDHFHRTETENISSHGMPSRTERGKWAWPKSEY